MPNKINYPVQGAISEEVVEMLAMFDPGELVARGLIRGHESFRRHGYNSAVGTSEHVISTTQNLSAPWMPLAPQLVEVVSGSAADGVAGAGIQMLRVLGIDENWDFKTQDVVMNGLTPVELTGLWSRVLCAFGISTGVYRGANTGTITIRETESAANVVATMESGASQCGSSHWAIPNGKALLVKNYNIRIGTGKTSTCYLRFAPGGDVVTEPFSGAKRVLLEVEGLLDGMSGIFSTPFALPAGSDIWASGLVLAQTGHIFFDYSGTMITL